MFFLIDWDLNSEINIHTFHRTEHLVTIYFKGKFFSSHQAVGQMGKKQTDVWVFSDENKWFKNINFG